MIKNTIRFILVAFILMIVIDIYIEYKNKQPVEKILQNTFIKNQIFIKRFVKKTYELSKQILEYLREFILMVGNQDPMALKKIIIGVLLALVIIYKFFSFRLFYTLIILGIISAIVQLRYSNILQEFNF